MNTQGAYEWVNGVLALEHFILAGQTFYHFRSHPTGRVLRRLAPPLFVFFATGFVSHSFYASGRAAGEWVDWQVVRSVAVALVVPWLWFGQSALAMLPTKEEWERQVTAYKRLAEERDKLAREREAANALLRRKLELDSARARAVARAYDDLREWSKAQIWGKLNEYEVGLLREKLHNLLNAVS